MKEKQFAEMVFALAKKQGFDDCEVLVSNHREFEVVVSKGKIDNYTDASSKRATLRAIKDRRSCFATTEILDETSARFLVESAYENFMITDTLDEDDIWAERPTKGPFEYEDAFERVSVKEKIELAKRMEEKCLSYDKRIQHVIMSGYGHQRSEIWLFNTKGLELTESFGYGAAFVYLVASDGKKPKRGFRAMYGSHPNEVDVEKVALEASSEAISQLGAQPVKSGKYKVLLRRDVFAQLFFAFSSIFSAEAVQKGLSPLRGKLHQKIAAETLSLIEDPFFEKLPMKRSFDNEGVPTTRKSFIDHGTLTTFFHSIKSARKDNVKPTGNVFSQRCVPLNVILPEGSLGYEDLIESVGEGLLVIALDGLHSGVRPVSGEFSLGANGYRIADGKIVEPVEQFTVSGNFLDVLQKIELIGSDCEIVSANWFGPSVVVSELDIAGS
ncbi:MAG: Peptidase U62 modulator of DNA gyrase [Thermotoga sp. 50_1627]|uniref:TldD/PmbA family protein n=1 Tax=Pseudothermotoga sp. TaxID=2033661 RepID=UPI00076D025B|nr:MAG: Peptidase U62 modulator of DNA gyrase [Thermotoga sp. 50_64]KUK25525.1 MAG: Peptidase U62 modulator of DNA gyrase [Thermotoga sp. 50_1627]MBC7116550.1 TldD/PmbA family protein [Pseudothermotoga sp.]MDK2922561.1 PmbA protein [Pseudothermotoga sp.]HBT40224.1 TldD/PmbA family protein [Pseudothermotoga sp.]